MSPPEGGHQHHPVSRHRQSQHEEETLEDPLGLEHELSRDADSFVDVTAEYQHNSSSSSGSTVAAAIFNFTNCIIGAGAIGLGGAIAEAGGLISVGTILLCAVLVMTSLDLVVELSLSLPSQQQDPSSTTSSSSYEELGRAAYGPLGKVLVMAAKFAYSFGCLVAYTVVIQDNFGPAVSNLLYGGGASSGDAKSWLFWLLNHSVYCTWCVSTLVVLPLCLLRDMTPLASASVVSIISMLSIVAIVIYLWWIDIDKPPPLLHDEEFRNYYLGTASDGSAPVASSTTTSDFYQHWVQIHWLAYLNNLGTFVFTFVCQHTVHLAYASLKPEIRNLQTWKRVSTASLFISCSVSLSVGVFVYMTFWERTLSDIFTIYPDSILLDLAKLLLCITMLLTFPLPFFSCRELVILFFWPFAPTRDRDAEETESRNLFADLEEPLLLHQQDSEQQQDETHDDGNDGNVVAVHPADAAGAAVDDNHDVGPTAAAAPALDRSESMAHSVVSLDLSVLSTMAIDAMNSVLLPGEERQLKLSYHVGVTCKLWFVVTAFAIASPNLGDVLDLVGCASGTLIAFVFPGCFAIRLQGYSHTAALLLVVGGVVGTVGTICGLKKFVKDAV